MQDVNVGTYRRNKCGECNNGLGTKKKARIVTASLLYVWSPLMQTCQIVWWLRWICTPDDR